MSTPSRKAIRLVSEVFDDIIVEAVLLEDGQTKLAVSVDGTVSIHPTWRHLDKQYEPVSAAHNLIKHNAVRLPGEPIEYGASADLAADIEAYAHKYLALSADFLQVASSYILLTWIYDDFNELPYLRFRGDYGSGKSRALTIFGSVLYKGFFASGASTVSPIFHTLDAFRASLILDEADFRFTDEKAELVKILNNGNAKGFPVLRTHVTAAKEFEPRAFSVYGPKIVGMRGSYDDRALESRFLTEEMSGQVMRPDIPISLPAEQAAEAHRLRSKLLMFRFRERGTHPIRPDYACAELEPRLNQILLPLLSVAPTETARQAILAYANRMQRGIQYDRSGSTEGQLLTVLSDLWRDEDILAIPLQAIATSFIERFAGEYDRPITNRLLGSVLRNRVGLPLYKSNGVIVVSMKDKVRIKSIFNRYKIGDSDQPNASGGPGR